MCNNAYEKISQTTTKPMIFCRLKKSTISEMLQLCISQKYCVDKDKYVPINQKQDCKFYE